MEGSENECSGSTAPQEDRRRRDPVGDEVAYARLTLIGPLFDTALSRSERRSLAKDLAGRGLTHPTLGYQTVSPRTVWRWYQAFKEEGFDGLRPRYRRDRGQLRSFPEAVLAEAVALKKELPARTVGRVIELLELDEKIAPGTVPRSTLQRHLQAAGLTGRHICKTPEDAQRFRAKRPGDVWQSDEKFGPFIYPHGEPERVRIFGFLDDHCRHSPGTEGFLEGTEANLERLLRRAIEVWRPPTLIYVDNGGPFVAGQFRRICVELGIALAHTRPYRPCSKGKVERYWETLDSFIVEANAARYTSLAQLNDALHAWVDLRYNQQPHSALEPGQTPWSVYSAALEEIPPVDPEDLDRVFRHLVTRKVHKDGTFSLGGVLFQVPALFRGKVELRVHPDDPTDVWVYRGTQRLVRAELFSPPHKLPRRDEDSHSDPTGDPRPLDSSRRYLQSLTDKHRSGIEDRIQPPDQVSTRAVSKGESKAQTDAGERLDLDAILQALDLPTQSLNRDDLHAAQGFFDTFGPFDRSEALAALADLIARWGPRRHLTHYLRGIAEILILKRTNPGDAP